MFDVFNDKINARIFKNNNKEIIFDVKKANNIDVKFNCIEICFKSNFNDSMHNYLRKDEKRNIFIYLTKFFIDDLYRIIISVSECNNEEMKKR